MGASKRLQIVQPQVPERIRVKKPEKKLVTVILTDEDFGSGEEAYPGLWVTCNVNLPMSTIRAILGVEDLADKPDSKEQIAIVFNAIDLITTDVLVDWNVDYENGKPMPVSALQDLQGGLFKAAMRAIMKTLGGKQLNPNSATS